MDQQADEKNAGSGSFLFRRLIRRQVAEDVSGNSRDKVSSDSRGGDLGTSGVVASLAEIVSSSGSGGDASFSSRAYVRNDRSLLSLQPWIFRKGNSNDDRKRMEENGEFSSKCGYERSGLASSLLSPISNGSHNRLGSYQGSIRRRRSQGYYGEPITSIESCFIPQLYDENHRIDEYVFSSLPSPPAPTLRPLLITDGSRIISRSRYDSSSIWLENGLYKNADDVTSSMSTETVFHRESDGVSSGVIGPLIGVPRLPESRKSKRKMIEVQHGRLCASNSGRSLKFSHSEGSLDGMLLFCLGFSIGVMSTALSNKIEVEKLNKSLEHSEELVKDLKEELDMKHSMIVKELTNEACECQEASHYQSRIEEYMVSFQDQNPTSHFTALGTEEYDSQLLPRTGEKLEELSKIEAELEAELERLEQNINASNLQRRMSDLSELDRDLIGDVVHGELRADMLDRGAQDAEHDGNGSTNSTSTTHTQDANYSVPPKELSLRLHEVIEARLEERIKELETALLQSQRQLQSIEAEQLISQTALSNSDVGSSSNQESSTVIESNGPLCLNLSGDALDAYDEAYEEFMRMAETKDPPSPLNTSEWIDRYVVSKSDRSIVWELEGSKGNQPLTNSRAFETEATWVCWSRESIDTIEGGEEHGKDDISDDEEGKTLIQQILEKTRQGSPVLTYAQRMLSLMDE